MIIPVNVASGSYDVVIKRGCLKEAGEELNLNRKVIIVTDELVPKQYAQAVLEKCKDGSIFTIGCGENYKSIESWNAILSEMLRRNFSRGDCVVAVGGGVVGDLAGFVAASYMRGVDFYNIPTTVLSQVDSSIGGKTAVNIDGVKNVVGAFYQPKKVLIDPDVLETLPKRQIANGLAEAVKMSLTSDAKLFEVFETKDAYADIENVLAMSINIKRAVVEEDEKESGLRKILNFGHTLGHGIEVSCSSDGKDENENSFGGADGGLYHGEAVAVGMVTMCSDEVKDRLIKVLDKLGLPTSSNLDIDKAVDAVKHDKKSKGDYIDAVYVPEVGKFEMIKITLDEAREKLVKIAK